jgi:hypothetical protein
MICDQVKPEKSQHHGSSNTFIDSKIACHYRRIKAAVMVSSIYKVNA